MTPTSVAIASSVVAASKDALLFEIMFDTLHDGVAGAQGGGEALRAIVRETVTTFGSRVNARP